MALAIIARQSYDSTLIGVLIINGNMTIRPLVIVVCTIILGVVFVAPQARAQELYSGVVVNVSNLVMITMLVGPIGNADICEAAREASESGLQDSCPQCTVTYSRCFPSSGLHNTYQRMFDQLRVPFPYVIAENTRTVFSEGPYDILVEMCEETAATLRAGQDPDTFCMLPSN